MLELLELISDIDKLREKLYSMIERSGFELDDPEVLEASERLNQAIVSYDKLLKEKML